MQAPTQTLCVAGTVGIDPATLSGLLCQLDAMNAASLTVASGAITTWFDLTANNYDYTQATADWRPVVSTANLGGKKGVYFDGTNDYLMASLSWRARSEYTAITVSVPDAGGYVDASCYVNLNGEFTQGALVRFNNNKEVWASGRPNYVNGSFVQTAVTAGAAYGIGVIRFQTDKLTVNAQGGLENNLALATANSTGANRSRLGVAFARESGATESAQDGFSKGTMHEYLFFSRRLTDDETTGVIAFLTNKWGIPTS